MRKLSSSDMALIERIKELKSLHPFFGYRRIWAQLKFKDGLTINRKKVYRLMKISDLLTKPNLLLRANRSPQKDKPRPERLNEWWGIDMTKIRLRHLGWVYITIVIDWFSKQLVGYSIGTKSKSSDWLEAFDMAVNDQFPNGVREEVERRGYELNLMADNGCQPTSDSFKKTCETLGINLAFTSYNNPKGNADTERFMRTMKEECLWINEWENLQMLTKSLKHWFGEYNQNYLHSKLHYKSPIMFALDFIRKAEIRPEILQQKQIGNSL
jgi:putative transposase